MLETKANRHAWSTITAFVLFQRHSQLTNGLQQFGGIATV